MLRYVALVWNECDVDRCSSAKAIAVEVTRKSSRWNVLVDQPGIWIAHHDEGASLLDHVYRLGAQRGVLLGQLFCQPPSTNECAPPPPSFRTDLDDRTAAQSVTSAGQVFIDKYWGQYVAFICDAHSQKKWIVRDPTGGVPCQYTNIGGVSVYFVRVEDIASSLQSALCVNRRFVTGYLCYSGRSTHETGIEGIETVLPGERITHTASTRTSEFCWNPLQIATQSQIESPSLAADLTRKVVHDVVHAWASRFDGILLALSGGLDSSIIAACLTDTPTAPKVVCRNFYDDDPDSDERAFARHAANRGHFELVEEQVRNNFSLDSILRTPASLFPMNWPIDVEGSAKDEQHFKAAGLSAAFTGDGGDEVFFRAGTFPVAVDYAWQHGPRRKLLTIAMDDATLLQTSLWKVLRLAWQFGVTRRQWHMRDSARLDHRPLMHRAIKAEAQSDLSLWHPLYRNPPPLPPGKLQHAYLMTYGLGRVHVPTGHASLMEHVAPLLSQPLVELSLRIPVYLTRLGGRDRAIARMAFAKQVPPPVISRRSKVFGDNVMRDAVAANLQHARELLLDGWLVKQGILDRKGVECALLGKLSRVQTHITELCDYLSVEMWVQKWLTTASAPRLH